MPTHVVDRSTLHAICSVLLLGFDWLRRASLCALVAPWHTNASKYAVCTSSGAKCQARLLAGTAIVDVPGEDTFAANVREEGMDSWTAALRRIWQRVGVI